MNKILVTGGAGYIGSHTVLSLLEQDYDVTVIDNLSNSSKKSMDRVEELTNRKLSFIQLDITCEASLEKYFRNNTFDGVIHFAALKSVKQSIIDPYSYYLNNLNGTLFLLKVLRKYEINNFIFSSSATVYGADAKIPYTENMKLGSPTSPYGTTKVMVEKILNDIASADKNFRAISLRYFNPIGAHASGMIGEDPKGVPDNLMPYITQVAIGKRNKLKIFGNNYPTPDGTCRRDYLHVMDLAYGHIEAMKWLNNQKDFKGIEAFNLGTGKPHSILEIISAFESETGKKIPYKFASKREGDLSEFWADTSKAKKILKWNTKYNLSDMIRDAWNWQSKNPNGY